MGQAGPEWLLPCCWPATEVCHDSVPETGHPTAPAGPQGRGVPAPPAVPGASAASGLPGHGQGRVCGGLSRSRGAARPTELECGCAPALSRSHVPGDTWGPVKATGRLGTSGLQTDLRVRGWHPQWAEPRKPVGVAMHSGVGHRWPTWVGPYPSLGRGPGRTPGHRVLGEGPSEGRKRGLGQWKRPAHREEHPAFALVALRLEVYLWSLTAALGSTLLCSCMCMCHHKRPWGRPGQVEKGRVHAAIYSPPFTVQDCYKKQIF